MLAPLSASGANGRQFRWRGRLYHLTYKGHIAHDTLVAHLGNVTSIKALGWSCVHEESDTEE